MGRLRGLKSRRGASTTDVVVITIVAIVVAGVLLPVLMSPSKPVRKPSCQRNLKEMGISLALYCGDYDNTLPSSYLYGGSKTWDPGSFSSFASIRGVMPPEGNETAQSWPMLLYPYMKNRDIMWCPSDPARHDQAGGMVSYYWKAAVDRAWYGDSKGKYRKDGDFDFPGDQIIFWEHNGWHWGDQKKGATDGVTLNVCYLDGHVQSKRIADSGYTRAENPPGPLPKSGKGEPAWFNYNMKANKGTGPAQKWNPKVYGDVLP